MKALSILQPWAQVLALGIKKCETRSWATTYRGPFLIHAGMKFSQEQKKILRSEEFNNYAPHITAFPRGFIIGAACITNCMPARDWKANSIAEDRLREHILGDTMDGRFVWEITHPVLFERPFPYKGQLQFFNVDLSADLENEFSKNYQRK